MLKLLRRRAVENPIFLRSLMGILAVTFIVSLGWWGTKEDQPHTMATIGEDTLSLEEYNRAYQNASRFYSQVLKTSFDKATIRKQVLDQLIEQRLWLQESQRMGLHITDQELIEEIAKIPGFQEGGLFQKERYHRILEVEKMTPEQFEQQQRHEMLIQKAKSLIRDATALTPNEIEELEKLDSASKTQEQTNKLNQKREKAVRAYTLALKQKASIVINEELL